MITEKDITFENELIDGRNLWQDVIANGKTIGALCHRQGSLLLPMSMWLQKLVPESEAPKFNHSYTAEDEGMIFAVWDFDTEFNDFVNYINSIEGK